MLTEQTRAYQSSNQLRLDLIALLRKQGFNISSNHLLKNRSYSKENIRAIHLCSREDKLERERIFIARWFPRIFKYFASGSDVDPSSVDPYPIVVENNEEYAALFRIASLWWSVPVSRGFGRRFRILIFDRTNGRLFGLLGLTDPVFNLKPRDSWIGWDVQTRENKLAHVMDAYVLGAVPPYNRLLGAKFVGLLAASDFIREVFQKRYQKIRSIIAGREFDGRLAMVTATSALGKSSIYNRLRFDGVELFNLIGFTEGYGHFHLTNGTYEQLRQYLRTIGDAEVKRCKFGDGPNYKFRIVRKALEHLHLPAELLRHGIRRGVYAAPLAANAAAFLRNDANRLQWYHRPIESIAEFWRDRWLLPRASRDSSYRDFDREIWKKILAME